MWLLFASVLTLFITFILLSPLFVVDSLSAINHTTSQMSELLDQKERHLQALLDLELDLKTNKISTDEYEILKTQILLDLKPIINSIEKTSEKGSA